MPPVGSIFDVKRFAVHDGPGVRTTLFLKACSLCCRWCHNPEGIDPKPELAYYPDKCLHCGECVEVCPQAAHAVHDGGHVFERTVCVVCGRCTDTCLGRALKLYGREISVDEARNIVLEDRDFYGREGGVTLSGGEPLLQPDFCVALFEVLKQEGVGCAVDTSGAVEWANIETVLALTDIFLYDLKHVDDALHRENVGASNARILRNLERLSTQKVPIEVRVPLIPGFNLDEHSLRSIANFLAPLKIQPVRFLPYHPVQSKFQAVGRANLMPTAEPPSPDHLAMAKQVFADTGLILRGLG